MTRVQMMASTCAAGRPTDATIASPDSSLNLERVQLVPLLHTDDDFLVHVLHADINPTLGLLADQTPPYQLYPANLNHVGPLGNPVKALG